MEALPLRLPTKHFDSPIVALLYESHAHTEIAFPADQPSRLPFDGHPPTIMDSPLDRQAWGRFGDSSYTSTSLITVPLSSLQLLLIVLLALTLLFLIFLAGYRKILSISMANSPAMKSKLRDTGKDFKGDVKVNNKPPIKEQLEKVADLPVLDVNRKSHTFKSLYADDENGPRRVLVIFIRHFFCGVRFLPCFEPPARSSCQNYTGTDIYSQNCQEYLHCLSSSVTLSALSTLSPPTSIVVIGCGSTDLIPMYIKATGCPYPIYADPTRRLYDMLGMTKTLSLGSQTPQYLQRSLLHMVFSSFMQEIRSGRKMLSGGDFRQVGGEFLFSGDKVTFCKRMKNTRDHAEISEIRKQLGLDRDSKGTNGNEKQSPAKKRWSTSGLGGGLGRKLSNRRRSWAPTSLSQSRNPETKGSPVRNGGMQKLREEDTVEAPESATTEVALAKLEGKATAKKDEIHATPMDGPGLATSAGAVMKVDEKVGDGPVVDDSTDNVMNGTANGHVDV